MGCPLLVGGENVPDSILILIKLVIDVKSRSARIAEDRVYSVLGENLYDNL